MLVQKGVEERALTMVTRTEETMLKQSSQLPMLLDDEVSNPPPSGNGLMSSRISLPQRRSSPEIVRKDNEEVTVAMRSGSQPASSRNSLSQRRLGSGVRVGHHHSSSGVDGRLAERKDDYWMERAMSLARGADSDEERG